MPIFTSDRINDKLKTISPATPSENVPKGLYHFKVTNAQRGRDNKNDVYLKLELTKLNAQKGDRSYTFGKIFKTASNEGRAEQELADFLAAADAMGFSAEQVAQMELNEMVGHEGIVGFEELPDSRGGFFSATGYGAWFRLDSEAEITWTPRNTGNGEGHQPSHEEIAEGFRNRGREYADSKSGNRRRN